MPTIKPQSIRDLKERVSLFDVVSRTTTLRKSGSHQFKGLCPFHSEKTPSFNVDTDKGFFKCFGCGKAGDVIQFVKETERLSFPEAAESLAHRYNIVLEYENGEGPSAESRSLRQELFDLHEIAADFYRNHFHAQTETGVFVRDYWQTVRRFPLDLAEEFRIGAAPAADTELAALLLRQNFSPEAIRQSGLFFTRGDSLTPLSMRPRFRGRLMIPIRDHQGRVVAFTARQLGITPRDDPAYEAKYVNSPETPIFTKGNILFNLDRARMEVGDRSPFVLVEGQLDSIRCWQFSIRTAIAPQGTAITEQQLNLLRRYQPVIDCVLDGDSAGQAAALRFLPLALRAGLEVRFLRLPDKTDPDALLLNHGAAAFEQLRSRPLSAMAFACSAILPSPEHTSAEAKTRAGQAVFEIITQATSEVTRSEFLAEAAGCLRVPLTALQADFSTYLSRAGERSQPKAATAIQMADEPHRQTAERDLLLICLHRPDLGGPLSQLIPPRWINTNTTEGRLLNAILAEHEQGNPPDRTLMEQLASSDEERSLIAALCFEDPRFENPTKIANEALRALQNRALATFLREIEAKLATLPGDQTAADLMKERQQALGQLRRPVALPEPQQP